MNRHFSKEEMTNKHILKSPVSLAITEMQLKITIRYLTPVTMAIIKKTNNKPWHGHEGRGTLDTLLARMQISILLTKSSMKLTQKTRNRTII